ncbi:MAG: hypothetical protein VXW87_00280 [Pseudomonadota bacterium]|nr:hypothetical protein [Pseudomonadota bacterium]
MILSGHFSLISALNDRVSLSAFHVVKILVSLQKMGLREPYQDRRIGRKGAQWFIKANASGYIPYLVNAYMVSGCKVMPDYQEMVASQDYKNYRARAKASTMRPF